MQDQYLPSGTGDDSLDTPADLDAAQPVQHFAFGGIANPAQSPFLRGSDREYLEARQKELDAFEKQRVAYNDALTKWQTESYNPYKAQVDAYNAAAQKYNTEVYDPYKSQVEAYNQALGQYNEEVYNPYAKQYADYEAAINAYNAGGRESDYAGPAAPTLARTFDMTMPTAPGAFGMTAPTAPEDFKGTAPVLPFKEEDVVAYQREAASRAKEDASQRALAIDVVSNPDQFNFGSMSVASRFMAKGGPVEKSSAEMMAELMASHTKALEAGLAAAKKQGAEALAAAEKQRAEAEAQRAQRDAAFAAEYRPIYEARMAENLRTEQRLARYAKEQAEFLARRSQYEAQSAARRAQEEAAARRAQEEARAVVSSPSPQVATPPRQFDPISVRPPLVQPVGGFSPLSAAFANLTTPFAPTPGQGSIQSQTSAGFSPRDSRLLRNLGRYESFIPRRMDERRDENLRPRALVDSNQPDGGNTVVEGGSVPQFDYTQRGVGSVGDIGGIPVSGPAVPGALPSFSSIRADQARASDPGNFFALSQPAAPGMNPGTVSVPYNPLAMYQGPLPVQAIANNPNLSPQMLGGQQNAGMMTDRLGNRIYAPGMLPMGFAQGGEADINAMRALVDASNMADPEDAEGGINTDPVGSAKGMLSALTAQERPRAKATGRVGRMPSTGGGAESPKEMALQFEALMSQKDAKPKAARSAQAELRALARSYQLKRVAAENAARGLMRNTLGAPTLEKPTLEQPTLTTRRFAEGGEAKKAQDDETESSASRGLRGGRSPSILNATLWADAVSRDMYPSEYEDTQRDAARHMLASAFMANKTTPGIANALGKFHEFNEAPLRTAGHWLGLSKPRGDYPTDVHNNALGVSMASLARDPAQLERAVRDAISRGTSTQIEKGRVSLVPDDAGKTGYAASQERRRSPRNSKTAAR